MDAWPGFSVQTAVALDLEAHKRPPAAIHGSMGQVVFAQAKRSELFGRQVDSPARQVADVAQDIWICKRRRA
jgi:hypothetical protein